MALGDNVAEVDVVSARPDVVDTRHNEVHPERIPRPHLERYRCRRIEVKWEIYKKKLSLCQTNLYSVSRDGGEAAAVRRRTRSQENEESGGGGGGFECSSKE